MVHFPARHVWWHLRVTWTAKQLCWGLPQTRAFVLELLRPLSRPFPAPKAITNHKAIATRVDFLTTLILDAGFTLWERQLYVSHFCIFCHRSCPICSFWIHIYIYIYIYIVYIHISIAGVVASQLHSAASAKASRMARHRAWCPTVSTRTSWVASHKDPNRLWKWNHMLVDHKLEKHCTLSCLCKCIYVYIHTYIIHNHTYMHTYRIVKICKDL